MNDTGPHGTAMAGLALFGDLTPLLAGDRPVALSHRLQSVKLIHNPDPHRPDLYGESLRPRRGSAATRHAIAKSDVGSGTVMPAT